MTRKRNDGHSTEYGLWTRDQKNLASKKLNYDGTENDVYGFVATNLDYIWGNYRTGKWMLHEEKRFMCELTYSQENLYKALHNSIDNVLYAGFHHIMFEKTNPEDGKVFVNDTFLTTDEFILFLQFNDEILERVGTYRWTR